VSRLTTVAPSVIAQTPGRHLQDTLMLSHRDLLQPADQIVWNLNRHWCVWQYCHKF